MRRCAALAAATLACLAAAAPAAQADHVQPTVGATLTLGSRVKDCSGGVCGGSRRATIGWSASCGPGLGQEALEGIEVAILGVKPNGRRFSFDGAAFDSEEVGLTDTRSMVAAPGLRFVGQVKVTCSVEAVNAEGDLVEHRGSATADTAELYLPPRLAGFQINQGTTCGVNLTVRQSKRLLQAGQYFELSWYMRYSGASLFKSGVPSRRQVKLFARGAGLNVKSPPDTGILREFGEIGAALRPRRAGTLKIWATIGGKKTNTLRIKVLPKRC